MFLGLPFYQQRTEQRAKKLAPFKSVAHERQVWVPA